jgi:hypothetical protein
VAVRELASRAKACLTPLVNELRLDPPGPAADALQDSLGTMFDDPPNDPAALPAFVRDRAEEFYDAKLGFLDDYFDETINGVSFVDAFVALDEIDSALKAAQNTDPDAEELVKGDLQDAAQGAEDLLKLVSGDAAANGVAAIGARAPVPCGCAHVSVDLSSFTIHTIGSGAPSGSAAAKSAAAAGSTYVGFHLNYKMTCTDGDSALGCIAKIEVKPPNPAKWTGNDGPRATRVIICGTPCAKSIAGTEDLAWTAFIGSKPAPSFTPDGRANTIKTVDVEITCVQPGQKPDTRTVQLKLSFDSLGQVDAKLSTLSGAV